MKTLFKNIKSHDAELGVDSISATPLLRQVAYGTIFNDSKGRFVDGSKIRTSAIENIIVNDKGEMFIETLNTMYKVLKD